MTGSGISQACSRRSRSMVRHTLATTVVSHAAGLRTSVVSARSTRSHASCGASSASANDPSIRCATARSRARSCSNDASTTFPL